MTSSLRTFRCVCRTVAAALLLALPSVSPSLHAQRASNAQKCGAARDLMAQALEKIGPGSSDNAIADSNELLRRATRMCAELGDAWYYRSLFDAHLHDTRGAQTTLDQASMLDSDALAEKLDPLHLAAPPAPASPVPTGTGNRWALVIGIGSFADRNIQPLPHTADDAELFSETLQTPQGGGFPRSNIRTLIDGGATYKDIRSGLNWIARHAGEEDLVVIYIATHGSARSADSVAGANYLVTNDTVFGPEHDQDLLFGSSLAMYELVDTVATRIRARRTAIFIDTCYSGSTDAKSHGESVSDRDLGRFNAGAGRIVFSAARADQESHDSKALGHGYFTWFLVEALRAPGGPHTLGEIYNRIATEIPAQVASDAKPKHVEQNPVLSRSTPNTDFALTPASSPGGQ